MKNEMRSRINNKLLAMDNQTYQDKSHRLSNNLYSYLLNLKKHDGEFCLGVYIPIQKEPVWHLNFANSTKFKLALPMFNSVGEMEFCSIEWEALKRLNWNEASGDKPLVFPRVVIVPGIAFTKTGDRLGRGKGHFDRYLSGKDCLKIGVCFEEQIVDAIETNELDQTMNIVITDEHIYRGN